MFTNGGVMPNQQKFFVFQVVTPKAEADAIKKYCKARGTTVGKFLRSLVNLAIGSKRT